MADKMWDVQSKGAKNSSPKMIGKELVTLYKNYLSDFDFSCFILFLGGVSNTVRIDNNINSFDVSNVEVSALEKIIEGLKEECKSKTYINDAEITDDKINDFLSKIYFVIDDKMKGKSITIRTVDLGVDKNPRWFGQRKGFRHGGWCTGGATQIC